MCSIIKLRPQFYVHILDRNTNVTSLVIGPQTYTCFDHQKVVFGPEPMIIIPPLHYVLIQNPAKRDADGSIIQDKHGQVLLQHSEKEYRFASESAEPFPLYPGEIFDGKIRSLLVVEVGEALRIRALVDFWWTEHQPDETKGEDQKKNRLFRHAGDMWLFEGPGMYYPSVSEEILETVKEYVIHNGQALKITALRDCVDKKYEKERHTGDLWLMQEAGAYLPGPYEKVIVLQNALILSEKSAYHLRATQDHEDIFATERKQGEEWLVTYDQCATYQLDVYEEIVKTEELIILTNRQFMIVENPMTEEGKPDLGARKIIRGPRKMFLTPPYESLVEKGEVIVLESTDAVQLRALETFRDEALKKNRKPGDTWLHKGPGEYWPVLEAKIVRRRLAIVCIDAISLHIFDTSTILFLVAFLFILVALYFNYA